MTITAIIDCYNSAEFLAEAIKSVLSQTRQPDDFIIVDDGSQDESVAIAQEMTSGIEWARVIVKENGGQLSCVSKGIVEAKGELLALLDGDDYWLEHHLEKAEEQFKKHKKLSLYFSSCTACGESEHYMNRSCAPGLIGQTQVVTACGASYIGGLNSSLVAKAESLKPYLPLPHEIERDWVVNADNIIVWLTSLYGGFKYAEYKPGVRYRLHPENNFKKLRGYPERIHRKAATARFFEYCRKTYSIPANFALILSHEYRAHPTKTKALRKDYLKALSKSSYQLTPLQKVITWSRIFLAR